MTTTAEPVRLAGSVGEATRRALAAAAGRPTEIEVEREDQIEEALAAGATLLLLDNFSPEQVRQAVRRVAGFDRTRRSTEKPFGKPASANAFLAFAGS